MSAAVVLAQSAEDVLLALRSQADARAAVRRLRALEVFPEMGSAYDSEYPAARPDHNVLVTYAGNLDIYYVYEPNDDGGTVYVEWIRDERANPERPFE